MKRSGESAVGKSRRSLLASIGIGGLTWAVSGQSSVAETVMPQTAFRRGCGANGRRTAYEFLSRGSALPKKRIEANIIEPFSDVASSYQNQAWCTVGDRLHGLIGRFPLFLSHAAFQNKDVLY
jgi:hypothetical protein